MYSNLSPVKVEKSDGYERRTMEKSGRSGWILERTNVPCYEIQLSVVEANGCRSSRQLTSVGTHLMRIQWPTVVAGHGVVLAARFLRYPCSCVFEKNSNNPRYKFSSKLCDDKMRARL